MLKTVKLCASTPINRYESGLLNTRVLVNRNKISVRKHKLLDHMSQLFNKLPFAFAEDTWAPQGDSLNTTKHMKKLIWQH